MLEVRKTFYSNGNPKVTVHYKSRLVHGLYQVWYVNGIRYYIDTNRNNIINGVAIELHYDATTEILLG